MGVLLVPIQVSNAHALTSSHFLRLRSSVLRSHLTPRAIRGSQNPVDIIEVELTARRDRFPVAVQLRHDRIVVPRGLYVDPAAFAGDLLERLLELLLRLRLRVAVTVAGPTAVPVQ